MEEHRPVMLTEVLYFLDVLPGKRFIDATLGLGGHTEAILGGGGEVLGIDQDPKSLEIAKRRLEARFDESKTRRACPGVFKGVLGNFSRISEIALQEGWSDVHGILFDLGFSSFQIEDPAYGLSFANPGPLDMRLDPMLGVTAGDLVNSLNEKELFRLFSDVGQETRARTIARAIVRRRKIRPFRTTEELKRLSEEVYGGQDRISGIHPATKVFLALRIAVNSEFENLKEALLQVPELLKKSGRLVVISFHSGEDRIVKTFIKDREKMGTFKNLTVKPVRPSEAEVKENFRSRSSKLRAVEKI